jgi:hypothetical protein
MGKENEHDLKLGSEIFNNAFKESLSALNEFLKTDEAKKIAAELSEKWAKEDEANNYNKEQAEIWRSCREMIKSAQEAGLMLEVVVNAIEGARSDNGRNLPPSYYLSHALYEWDI